MSFNRISSLDMVEAVMAFEEAFGVELPIHESGDFDSPQEIVAWLERHLSNQRPNKQAAARLRKLAKDQNNPELAEGLEGTWRREQIAQSFAESSASSCCERNRLLISELDQCDYVCVTRNESRSRKT